MEHKLKALPFQVIELEDRVVLKRGLSSMAIPDKSALLIVKVIQKALLQRPLTVDELAGLFTGSLRNLITSFIQHLIAKKFIVPLESEAPHPISETESPQDIFYWHFNAQQSRIAEALNEKPWAFIGINQLNKQLLRSLFLDGKDSVWVVDDPSLRNVSFFDDSQDILDDFWKDERIHLMTETEFTEHSQEVGFLIASSEFGSFYLLESWNALAVKQDIPFYPLLLQNMVGYAGPLVIKDEGPCLECLKLRQNSASSDFAEKRLTEKFAFEGQSTAAYHHSMVTVLAEVGAFDLIKFKSNIQWDLGTLCEVDLLAGSMSKRKLVKAPRCAVCSPLTEMPLINIHRQLTSEDSWKEIEQTVGYDE
jgi:thiazole/oxazole-forming peptide maturase SagC family component